jgi:hypothetical protein
MRSQSPWTTSTTGSLGTTWSRPPSSKTAGIQRNILCCNVIRTSLLGIGCVHEVRVRPRAAVAVRINDLSQVAGDTDISPYSNRSCMSCQPIAAGARHLGLEFRRVLRDALRDERGFARRLPRVTPWRS